MTLSDEELVRSVTEFFFTNAEFSTAFEKFTTEKCDIFTDEEENKLDYTAVYLEFQQLFENLMGEHLTSLGTNPQNFYEICQKSEVKAEADSIVDMMLTVMSFDQFVRGMKRFRRAKNMDN
mmetsp:Transcript_38798/g.46987  ORF Transcript_38798/g.46987 Transcript_38798/m.46987 type:complete len:121 (-) Transcript_38798:212-574(-)|eukprot:CAMPEP_0197854076 /NCGR_PEP_ID=MMETSP1438-20131217/23996_1 /TAXON_ID=1461541 /ORGANISM="Pterosperma sp., Strain CCMP1384" /LENGTH=120 /DNA_ID=CAMNT_0043468711 /DNA_START=183 /DNA_END=545 /DNA_ORIENTATION=+